MDKKKTTTPYFTRARFVQARRTLRTRILQRYLYSISFFLSGTLHSSFLLSSRGWWTKNHYPLFHQSTLRPTEEDVTDQDPSKVYVLHFFLSFSNFTRVSCLFFFHLGGGGQKYHFLLFHQTNRGGRCGSGSFKGIFTLFLSLFLSRNLHSIRVFSSFIQGEVDKSTHYPYFTRSRFVQPSRTLRTRIFQRYIWNFNELKCC